MTDILIIVILTIMFLCRNCQINEKSQNEIYHTMMSAIPPKLPAREPVATNCIHRKAPGSKIRIVDHSNLIPVMTVNKQRECLGLTESFPGTNIPEELQVQLISEALNTRTKEDDMTLCQLKAGAEGTTGSSGINSRGKSWEPITQACIVQAELSHCAQMLVLIHIT